MSRPKNFAPKEMEGFYTVCIKDNQTIITKHKDKSSRPIKSEDKQTIVKCHPDDSFDITEAVKIAMDRLHEEKIELGDYVEIVNNGYAYSTIGKYIYNRKHCAQFRHGVVPFNGTVGKVVEIINNDNFISTTYAILVEEDRKYGDPSYCQTCRDCVYLIDSKGVRKVNNELS